MKLYGKMTIYALAIIAVIIYGTVGTYVLGRSGNFNVNINSPVEALYFTVVTISTVGYGDITPVTTLGRIFVIILIISGLSIFLSAVTVISSDFLSERVERLYYSTSRSDKKLLNNHIVLIGYDITNALIAERLKKQKRNFIIITKDKILVDKLKERGYNVFLADYTLKQDMEKFMLDRASDVVIDLRDSSKAVYVVLVVKKLSKKVRLSVVVQNSEMESHLTDLGVDSIINPATLAADALTEVLDRDQDAVIKK
jgi:voltage-gated potassium channel